MATSKSIATATATPGSAHPAEPSTPAEADVESTLSYVDATCQAPGPLSEVISEGRVYDTLTWVTGTVEPTDRTIMSPLAPDTDLQIVLSQLTVRIDRVVAGRPLPLDEPIEAYVRGGAYQDKLKTIGGKTNAVSWGPEGRFFGALVHSDGIPATSLQLMALPLIDQDAIVSTGTGCLNFLSPNGQTLKASATMFIDGTVQPISGNYPVQSLSELAEQIRNLK